MEANWMRTARPHFVRAALGAILAVAGMVVRAFSDYRLKAVIRNFGDLEVADWLPVIAGALMLVVGGIIAVRALARAVRVGSREELGDARGAGLSLVVTLVGYLIVLISLLSTLGVNPAGLLLGGAITGVVIGIAAQQTLSNFFAGVVLLINRPLAVGEYVVMRSGPLGGEYEGLVTDMTLFYVKMETKNGSVLLPNAGVLASSIGPGARAPKDEDDQDAKEDDVHAAPSAGGAPDGTDRSAT